MYNRAFARVVFTAVVIMAALFVVPAPCQAAAASAKPAFTNTPLEQMQPIDVELDPVLTPTRTMDLTTVPQQPSTLNVNPPKALLQAATFRTLATGLSMLAAGISLICIPIVAESSGSKNARLTVRAAYPKSLARFVLVAAGEGSQQAAA